MGAGAVGLRWCSALIAAVVLGSAGCSTPSGARATVTSSAAPATTTNALAKAEASLRSAVTSYVGDGSGVIVLIRVGKDTRVVTLGMADVAASRALRAEDRFPVASITKSMVATAVLQYVAAGRIGLDDPVERFLPGLLPWKQITVRHLLTHRSGLHQLTPDEQPANWRPTHLQFVQAVVKHPLTFAPGTDFAYSNEGFIVLGLLLEKVSGQPLHSVLSRSVFVPAGMTATTLAGKPSVTGYSGYRIGQAADPPEVGDAWSAGGVVSTAADVDRFYTHLWSGDLLAPKLVEQMRQPGQTGASSFGAYGMGMSIRDTSCGQVLGHYGQITGFATGAWTRTDTDRSVVVMVNSDNASMASNLADAALCG